MQQDLSKSGTCFFLPGVQWAYRNTPHEATGEKPSYLLFGVDLQMPSVAALLPMTPLDNQSMRDYHREELSHQSTIEGLEFICTGEHCDPAHLDTRFALGNP